MQRTTVGPPPSRDVRRPSALLPTLLGIAFASSGCAKDERPDLQEDYARREAELLAELEAREAERRDAVLRPVELETLEWQVLERPDPVSGETVCAIVSGSRVLDHRARSTVARVVVTDGAFHLNGDTALDLSVPEAGIVVDAGFPLPFERVIGEVDAMRPDADGALKRTLAEGAVLAVRFGYAVPYGEPVGREIVMELDGFAEALEALDACLDDS